jgi:hypothetical protein
MASYKARGLVYLGARDYYREHVRSGLAAFCSELSRDLAEFLNQGFVATPCTTPCQSYRSAKSPDGGAAGASMVTLSFEFTWR